MSRSDHDWRRPRCQAGRRRGGRAVRREGQVTYRVAKVRIVPTVRDDGEGESACSPRPVVRELAESVSRRAGDFLETSATEHRRTAPRTRCTDHARCGGVGTVRENRAAASAPPGRCRDARRPPRPILVNPAEQLLDQVPPTEEPVGVRQSLDRHPAAWLIYLPGRGDQPCRRAHPAPATRCPAAAHAPRPVARPAPPA